MIPLFDLHCDTFLKLYKNNYNFENSPLHISLNKASCFSPYAQVCAIWSDCRLNNDDAYRQYKEVLKFIRAQNISLCKTCDDFKSKSFILSVEDVRILNNDIQRLYELYNDNVHVITLNWSGVTCIGGGWDTNVGLTSFGKDVVLRCIEMGIIIDLSHSSLQVQNEVISIMEGYCLSPIFSHSNAYSVCNHNRNIYDDIFRRIVKQNGVVGISLCNNHLASNGIANASTILKHIEHFLSLGGENSICIGCDFDGITSLPIGFTSISSLSMLYNLIENNFSSKIATKIFFDNAFNYFTKNFNERR